MDTCTTRNDTLRFHYLQMERAGIVQDPVSRRRNVGFAEVAADEQERLVQCNGGGV